MYRNIYIGLHDDMINVWNITWFPLHNIWVLTFDCRGFQIELNYKVNGKLRLIQKTGFFSHIFILKIPKGRNKTIFTPKVLFNQFAICWNNVSGNCCIQIPDYGVSQSRKLTQRDASSLTKHSRISLIRS